MARAHDEYGSLRFSRGESSRVTVALLLSLLAHLAFWGTYYAGDRAGWWRNMRVPEWLHLTTKVEQFELQAQVAHDIDPTIFVDVSSADADAPKQTRFYSSKNSRAANPDVAQANVPRIEGKQKDVPKTETVPRTTRAPESPPPSAAVAETKEAKAAEEAAKTAAKETPKDEKAPDLAKLQPVLATPTPASAESPANLGDLSRQAKVQPAPATPARPRTLRQAQAQRSGLALQQEGGVARRAIAPSMDVKATQFGEYDRALIEAVQQRWDELLENHRYADDRTGKVLLRFKLKPDGSVIEMQTTDNTVGELLGYLCQEAIEEAAPFAKWPPDMVRMIGANYREITFTFYYY